MSGPGKLVTRHRLVVESSDKAYLGAILDFIAKEFGNKVYAYEIRERQEWVKVVADIKQD